MSVQAEEARLLAGPGGAADGAPKRRVLLVTREVDGGLGQHFVDLAAGLAARGWAVHCARAENTPGVVTTHLHRLDSNPAIRVHSLPIRREVGRSDWTAYRAFRELLGRYGPFDITHGHGAKAGVLARLPSQGLGARFYTPHGLITSDTSLSFARRSLYRLIEGGLGRLATDAMILVSEEERREALRLGAPKEICHLIPNGMAEPAFLARPQARAELDLPPGAEVVLFVGRFVHAKAPERFLRLVAALAAARPALIGVLIGSGAAKAQLSRQALDLGIFERLRFFETNRASAYMKAADLLVVPSRYEGMAYTMIESLAAGLPLVAFDVPGASSVVRQGETGFVVPQGNEVALARQATRLLDDPAGRARLSAAARWHFGSFRLGTMIDRTQELYRRALGETACATRPIAA